MTLSVEQQADLASLLYELGHNPSTRQGLAQLVNKVDPQRARASFPDVAQQAQFARLEQKIDQKLQRDEAQKAKEQHDRQREKLRERYSDEQIGEIEKERNRIGGGTWDDAAVLYAAKNPEADPRYQPPSQSERPGAKWDFPTVAGKDGKPMSFKDFAADPRTHSMDAAYQVISEFKNAKLSQPFRR
jgi:hypothetical protein